MRTYLPETLKALEERREEFEKIVEKIKRGEDLLAHDDHIVFEAHIQTHSPENYSIMAEGDSIYEACQKAAARNGEWNNNNSRRFEVFAKIGDFRIAIDPKDVAKAISEEMGEEVLESNFRLDERTTKFPSPMVFGEGDEMPSCWYTTKPTQPRVINPKLSSSGFLAVGS